MAQSAFRKLFVYGTLKVGEPNHHWLSDTKNGYAKFICKAATTKKMPLVIATRYNIPFLISKEGMGNYIAGEIYEVDDKMMKNCDILEDYPNLYDKEIQDLNIGVGDGTIPCYIYLLKKYPESLLKKPMLSEYRNTPELPYLDRSKRVDNILAKDDLNYKIEV